MRSPEVLGLTGTRNCELVAENPPKIYGTRIQDSAICTIHSNLGPKIRGQRRTGGPRRLPNIPRCRNHLRKLRRQKRPLGQSQEGRTSVSSAKRAPHKR